MVEAAIGQPARASAPRSSRALSARNLSAVFGVDIDLGDEPKRRPAKRAPDPTRARKPAASRQKAKKKK
jgi:hypothetical protein